MSSIFHVHHSCAYYYYSIVAFFFFLLIIQQVAQQLYFYKNIFFKQEVIGTRCTAGGTVLMRRSDLRIYSGNPAMLFAYTVWQR